jgi:hypothetical protein
MSNRRVSGGRTGLLVNKKGGLNDATIPRNCLARSPMPYVMITAPR